DPDRARAGPRGAGPRGGRLRRPGRAGAIAHGRADPGVHRCRRAAAPHALLGRRVGCHAAGVASAALGSRSADPAGVGPPDHRSPAGTGAAVSAARAARRLGLELAAPAFLAMTAVSGYPLLRAVWLSLFRDRLTDPTGR